MTQQSYIVTRDIPQAGYGQEFGFRSGEIVYQSKLVVGEDRHEIAVTRDQAGDGGYYRKVPLDALEPMPTAPASPPD